MLNIPYANEIKFKPSYGCSEWSEHVMNGIFKGME